MVCPHCDAELPDNAAFCGYCGRPLPMAPEHVVEERDASANSDPDPEAASDAVPDANATTTADADEHTETALVAISDNASSEQQSAEEASSEQQQSAEEASHKPAHKARKIVLGIVAALLVVVLIAGALPGVVWNVLADAFSGQQSAQIVADEVTTLYNELLTSDFDDEALEDFGSGVMDLMPPTVVAAALNESGYTRDEASEGLGSNLGVIMEYYGELLAQYTGMFTVSMTVDLGDELAGYELADVNDFLAATGSQDGATGGYCLTGTVTLAFSDDLLGYQAGDQQSFDIGDIGLYVVNIDDSWYLYPAMSGSDLIENSQSENYHV